MATTCEINGKKPEIKYPCQWKYKLIVLKDVNVEKIAKEILGQNDFKLSFSHDSKEGKYKSYTLSTLVLSDEQRQFLFESFKKNENIKYVL